MSKRKMTYLPLTAILALSGNSSRALAQQASGIMAAGPAAASPAPAAAPADTAIAEVIVTAQKRSQSLSNVGLSVTVASGDQLAALGVRSTDDLVKVAPGLTFTKSVDGSPLYTLRGVGFNDYTLGASPAVSIYVDQVALTYGQFARGATLDLERVEVVKGPQGILFGQNATGGAINYIANKPTRDFEAGGGVSYGRFDTFDGDFYVSGPVSDTLALRAAVSTTQSGPWQESVSRDASLGDQNIFRGRFLAEWTPTDKLTVLATANGWRDTSDTQAAQLQGVALQVKSGAGQGDPAEIDRRIAALLAQPLAENNARSADWDIDRSLRRDDGFYQFSLRGDYKATKEITLTSITAYSKYNDDYGLDRDGTTLSDEGALIKSHVEVFNQELRAAGDYSRLNWLVGGNYANNQVYSNSDAFIGDATNTYVLPGLPIVRTNITTTQGIHSYAGFANAEYKLTDQITLLGGGRYTKTITDFTACLTGDANSQQTFKTLGDILSGVSSAPVTPTDCTNLAGDNDLSGGLAKNQIIRSPFADNLKENNISWRSGVNYKPYRNLLLYGLISRGFKSGGFGDIQASTTEQYQPVKQEQLTDYEAGAKITALDRKLQFNAAIFHYSYKDKQIRGSIIDPIFGLLDTLVNVPKSKIDGVEGELTARPISGLTLRASFAYVDSKVISYTGINNARIFGNFAGSALPFSPKWNAVADATYDWRLNDRLGAFVGGHVLYNSETNASLGDPSSLLINSFATLDLNTGIKSLDNRWTLSIYGRNVTNTYHWNNAYEYQDIIARLSDMPVTYGVSLRFNFR